MARFYLKLAINLFFVDKFLLVNILNVQHLCSRITSEAAESKFTFIMGRKFMFITHDEFFMSLFCIFLLVRRLRIGNLQGVCLRTKILLELHKIWVTYYSFPWEIVKFRAFSGFSVTSRYIKLSPKGNIFCCFFGILFTVGFN